MRANARGLRVLVKSFDRILTSPYARASETADIVARVFKGPQPESLEALTPGGRSEDVLATLRHGDARSIAMVGHEPDLSTLLAWLVTGEARPFCELKKGGVCLLEWDGTPAAGKANLHWIVSPKLLRRLVG
jgi:phosphohistidine phosphatase